MLANLSKSSTEVPHTAINKTNKKKERGNTLLNQLLFWSLKKTPVSGETYISDAFCSDKYKRFVVTFNEDRSFPHKLIKVAKNHKKCLALLFQSAHKVQTTVASSRTITSVVCTTTAELGGMIFKPAARWR